MSHTQGKLAVSASLFDNEGRPETVIVGVEKNAFVAVAIDFGENNPGMRDANARRLVACWNACEGISTEDLESERNASIGWARTASKLLKATTERGSLRAVNAELLEALENMHKAFNVGFLPQEQLMACIKASAAIASANELKGTE